MTNLYKTKILGTGSYFPKKVMTNLDLEKIVDTSDEWIFERTGIRERRISDPKTELPTDMAYQAATQALERSHLKPNDIDMILFATCTGDFPLPNCASVLQTKLGISNQCACLDIQAACSGFIYGLTLANSTIQTGLFKNILVIGSEMLSRLVNWKDRASCILFGDGCGAAIVSRNEGDDGSSILSSVLGADGIGNEFIKINYGGTSEPISQENLEDAGRYIFMQGREMFRVATRTLAENGKEAIEKAGLTLEDIDWVVPHQANIRIIEAAGKRLGIPKEKVIVNIEKYANTSSATIPTTLDMGIQEGKIKRGDKVLCIAFGAGLTSGACVLEY